MISGTVFDIKRFALHDGPGLRTTVFLKGCPLDCAWCHNPEGISPTPQRVYRAQRCIGCGHCAAVCPEQALELGENGPVHDPRRCVGCGSCADACPAEAVEFIGKRMTVDQVLAVIAKDNAFYDQSQGGVTFSGGEPLLQPEFLLALLKACGRRDLHRTVDTTGFAAWELIRAVARRTELLLYDLKHMDTRRHQELTGVPNTRILTNLEQLVREGVSLWVRIPVIPGLNDSPDNIRRTGEFLSGLSAPPPVEILRYHCGAKGKYQRLDRSYTVAALEPPTDDMMTAIARKLRDFGLQVAYEGESHDTAYRQTA